MLWHYGTRKTLTGKIRYESQRKTYSNIKFRGAVYICMKESANQQASRQKSDINQNEVCKGHIRQRQQQIVIVLIILVLNGVLPLLPPDEWLSTSFILQTAGAAQSIGKIIMNFTSAAAPRTPQKNGSNPNGDGQMDQTDRYSAFFIYEKHTMLNVRIARCMLWLHLTFPFIFILYSNVQLAIVELGCSPNSMSLHVRYYSLFSTCCQYISSKMKKAIQHSWVICPLFIWYLCIIIIFALISNQLLSHSTRGQINLHSAELSHSLYNYIDWSRHISSR